MDFRFKVHISNYTRHQIRPLQSPGRATGLEQDWEQAEHGLGRQQDMEQATLPDTSRTAPATDKFLSYGAKR